MKASAIALRAFAPSFLALTACVATTSENAPVAREPAGNCSAEASQQYLGQKATLAMGGQLLEETAARRIRWVPPGTAVTMDYQPDRLTVSYDENYVIERISCG